MRQQLCKDLEERINLVQLPQATGHPNPTHYLNQWAKYCHAMALLISMRIFAKHEFKYKSNGIFNVGEFCIHCGTKREVYHDEI